MLAYKGLELRLAMCQLEQMKRHPLAIWREAQDPPMTQADLAVSLSVNRWTVNAIETGRRTPSARLMGKIMDVTDRKVTADQLVEKAA